MELSGEEKARIRMEEEFREKIRRDLEEKAERRREDKGEAEKSEAKKKETGLGKVWSFLNSSFGLLLFGSAILAMLGEGWRWAVAWRQEMHEANKIFIEISHRVGRVRDEASRLHAEGPKESHRKEVLKQLRLDHSRSPSTGQEEIGAIYAFTEYKNWSLQNLLFQLQMIGSDEHVKKAEAISLTLSNATYELGTNGVTPITISNFNWVIKECKLE